jgi:hypothetical protein
MSLTITHTQVYNLERAVVASGLPMSTGSPDMDRAPTEADWARARKLGRLGGAHAAYLRGVTVVAHLRYPAHWAMQFARYHFAEVISSQSKMHRLARMSIAEQVAGTDVLPIIAEVVERMRAEYNDLAGRVGCVEGARAAWHRLIDNCPLGLLLEMDITTNYAQLLTIYRQRAGHKLEEWAAFLDWIETLPRFTELTGVLE